MHVRISKAAIMLFAIFALIAQVSASAYAACEMPGDTHNSSHLDVSASSSHSDMHHHAAMDDGTNNPGEMAEDCCNIDCNCPANACNSTYAANSELPQALLLFHSNAFSMTSEAQLSSNISSLYRPPAHA